MAVIDYDVDPVLRREPLRALLDAYAADDADEQRHKQRMLALLDSAGDPFARAHFVPGHFTASAFVVSADGGALLLIHHAKLARWLQPGGHIEAADEDALSAARRELAEEVGLRDLPLAVAGLFDIDVHAIPQLGSEPPHEHFDLRFLFRAPDPAPRLGGEAKLAQWFGLSELERAETDRSVARALGKLKG
jgi:8-oxo-dGTP pyrophosphatase MutT (NUDIX family)